MNCPICKEKLPLRTGKRLEHMFSQHMEEFHLRMNAAAKAFTEWKP